MKLTVRQTQVVALVAKGCSDKRIASELGISTETVRDHVEQAARRVGVQGRPRLGLTIFFLTSHIPKNGDTEGMP
jgi:DNA-binding NarL/FixJ family response regulator